MTGYGPISLLFGLILGVAYLLIQLQVASTVTEAVESSMAPMSYTTEIEAVAEAAAEEKSFEIYRSDGRKTTPGKAMALLAPDTLGRARTVKFATFVDPETLLREGETMPDGELRDLMVEARSARLADAACARLRTTLATECGVRDFSTQRLEPADADASPDIVARRQPFTGHYLLTTEMLFTPKAPVGDFPDAERVTYNTKRFDFEPWEVDGPSPEPMAARADELMLAADRACEYIRAIHGNCVVTDLRIESRYRDSIRFQSVFELAWLTALQGAVPTEAAPDSTPPAPEPTAPAPAAPELVAPAPAAPAQEAPAAPAPEAPTPEAPSSQQPADQGAAPATPLKGGKAGKWVTP